MAPVVEWGAKASCRLDLASDRRKRGGEAIVNHIVEELAQQHEYQDRQFPTEPNSN